MSSIPIFIYTATPERKVRVDGLFDNGPVRQLLEQPGGLRQSGWDLETHGLGHGRVVKGEYFEVALSDQKTIQLFEDGALLAKVPANDDFLAWKGSNDRTAFEERPRLNPLALIELTYNFVWLYQRVTAYFIPQPEQHSLRVSFKNTTVGRRRLYLNPYGIETHARLLDKTQYPAPEGEGKVVLNIDAQTLSDVPRAAYFLVQRIYLWFGVPTIEIPYVIGEGDGRAIDVETIRKGGKEVH